MVVLRKLEGKVSVYEKLLKHKLKAYHKKNFQVRDGEHDSIIIPGRYTLGSYKKLLGFPCSDKGSSDTSWNLSTKFYLKLECVTLI